MTAFRHVSRINVSLWGRRVGSLVAMPQRGAFAFRYEKGFNGLPSMSVLKPLLLLHAETGDRKYLDYAAEMLPDWDREDGACPNFFRNAASGKALADWYPKPWVWAKCYELMSGLDGLPEYRRATGDAHSLETVAAIRENLAGADGEPEGRVRRARAVRDGGGGGLGRVGRVDGDDRRAGRGELGRTMPCG